MGKLAKVKRIGLVDQVCDIIKSNIITGTWPTGAKIPSESELAEMLGVNRLTVRMALQKLNTLGILQTRVGEGTFVIEFSFMEYMSEVSDFVLKPNMMEDMFEFRRLIEIECIRLAIVHYDERELATLQSLYEKYEQTVNHSKIDNMKDNLEAYIEVDLEFHYQIYRMSKNEVYFAVMCMMRDLMKKYMQSEYGAKWGVIHRPDMFGEDGRLIYEKDPHLRITNAIYKKNYEKAKAVFLEMIGEVR